MTMSRRIRGICRVVHALALMLAFAGGAVAYASADDGVDFFDSYSFDSSLSQRLSAQPDVTVVVPSGPFGPNQIPARLQKWLEVVVRFGGSVKLAKDAPDGQNQPKGVLADVVDMAVNANKDAELAAMYATAKGYDAVITYDGNNVTSVRFLKHKAAAK